ASPSPSNSSTAAPTTTASNSSAPASTAATPSSSAGACPASSCAATSRPRPSPPRNTAVTEVVQGAERAEGPGGSSRRAQRSGGTQREIFFRSAADVRLAVAISSCREAAQNKPLRSFALVSAEFSATGRPALKRKGAKNAKNTVEAAGAAR